MVKTTLDISDALLERAKRHAQRTHRPLRELVELGIQRILQEESNPPRYQLPDRSVGRAGDENPLEKLSWGQLRDAIYGGP